MTAKSVVRLEEMVLSAVIHHHGVERWILGCNPLVSFLFYVGMDFPLTGGYHFFLKEKHNRNG
jgi:hypothetical protein